MHRYDTDAMIVLSLHKDEAKPVENLGAAGNAKNPAGWAGLCNVLYLKV
jgi:hypothetical protein